MVDEDECCRVNSNIYLLYASVTLFVLKQSTSKLLIYRHINNNN